ncbi:VOC family protein [Luedemannella helvata]|uniref:VOC domain-containing protein n=1 Tax=Luedemannella helvata TaxID=349315 RepID=A0ABP4X407_9ACTN
MALRVITVGVHDMDAAVTFYTKMLGFDVRDASMAPHFVELESEGPTLLLAQCEQPAVSTYPAGATIALDVDTDDAAAALERFRAAGADLVHDTLQDSPVGPYFAVRDPSGNVIEMVQFD